MQPLIIQSLIIVMQLLSLKDFDDGDDDNDNQTDDGDNVVVNGDDDYADDKRASLKGIQLLL